MEIVQAFDVSRRHLLTEKLLQDIGAQYGGARLKSPADFTRLVQIILETLRLRLRDEQTRKLPRKDREDSFLQQRRAIWIISLEQTIEAFQGFLDDLVRHPPE